MIHAPDAVDHRFDEIPFQRDIVGGIGQRLRPSGKRLDDGGELLLIFQRLQLGDQIVVLALRLFYPPSRGDQFVVPVVLIGGGDQAGHEHIVDMLQRSFGGIQLFPRGGDARLLLVLYFDDPPLLDIVTLPDVFGISGEAAERIQHGGIQLLRIDRTPAPGVGAFVVEVPLGLLFHRRGAHVPRGIAAAPHHPGEQIWILPPPRTGGTVFFAGKLRLHQIEDLALDNRIVLASEDLAVI